MYKHIRDEDDEKQSWGIIGSAAIAAAITGLLTGSKKKKFKTVETKKFHIESEVLNLTKKEELL